MKKIRSTDSSLQQNIHLVLPIHPLCNKISLVNFDVPADSVTHSALKWQTRKTVCADPNIQIETKETAYERLDPAFREQSCHNVTTAISTCTCLELRPDKLD
jgi:hypothetical protein